jgi:hypothetical protein
MSIAGEKWPAASNSFQFELAPLGKFQPRARDQVPHRARSPNFVDAGLCGHSCGGVNRDAGDVLTEQFDLARVQPGTDCEADPAEFIADANALRRARAGPSNVASTPSPVLLIDRPLYRATARWVTSLCRARLLPALSSTARISSIRCSSEGIPASRSDSPVPRLSKRISRANDPSRSRQRAYDRSSHARSRCETYPGDTMRSIGPSPLTR